MTQDELRPLFLKRRFWYLIQFEVIFVDRKFCCFFVDSIEEEEKL